MQYIVTNYIYYIFVLLNKKLNKMKKFILTISAFLLLLTANSQTDKLSGPRIGFTFIGAGPVADFINTKDLGALTEEGSDGYPHVFGEEGNAFITQYGWQWETRFADGYDVTGLVEWIVLVGGMEKGLFLPSVSSLVGIRTSSNLEFAFGPNLSLSGIGAVVAVGYNFKIGEVNLPVNIAFRPGINKTRTWDESIFDSNGDYLGNNEVKQEYNTGALVSLIVGFNLGG
jgi:hypothetical protein